MMLEKSIRRFIKTLEDTHGAELNTLAASPGSVLFVMQVEARAKLSALYAVLEEEMPPYPCTRSRREV